MRNRAISGSRLAGPSTGEFDRGAPLAGRREVSYWCPAGHLTTPTLSDEIDPPNQWTCTRCGALATHDHSSAAPEERRGFHRTHYEFMMMRRTEQDGARLLEEALADLRRARHRPQPRTDGADATRSNSDSDGRHRADDRQRLTVALSAPRVTDTTGHD